MKFSLNQLGYYTSPMGGAPHPRLIELDLFFFELITAGYVYGINDERRFGPGWVFCHRKGDFTINRSDQDHYYECLTLSFLRSKDGALSYEDFPRSFFWGDLKAISTFTQELILAFHHEDMPKDIIGDFAWNQLRFRLNQFQREESRAELTPKIQKAILYMERFFMQDIGINEISIHVGLSTSHLHNKFKRVMGITPHQFIIDLRMRDAKHRLVSQDDPIKRIAYEVGYSNVENFCREFKKRIKVTPAKYRKMYTTYD
ncbi:MAG: AraC family transcriptional regulator [Lentisphaeria bacterium]|nr:AraC family transcriptional regulator [Lentisphaeria bacterium]